MGTIHDFSQSVSTAQPDEGSNMVFMHEGQDLFDFRLEHPEILSRKLRIAVVAAHLQAINGEDIETRRAFHSLRDLMASSALLIDMMTGKWTPKEMQQ